MLLLFLIISWAVALATSKCGLFLIPSTIANAGRGIAAGISYDAEFEIESYPTLPIPKALTQQTQLTHYVYGTGNSRFDMMMIGPASIYNHGDQRTVYYTWKDDLVADPSFTLTPYTNFTHTVFRTLKNIEQGSELFNFYGDKWFDRFESAHDANADQSSVNTSHKYSANDFKEHGHCLTDVTVDKSIVSHAGLGLFATTGFDVGEIVSISPVLAMSKSVIEKYKVETVLMNYCITTPSSKIALFPFNYGAMINHNSSGANVKVEWFDWSPAVEALAAKYHADVSSSVKNQNLRLSNKLQMSVRELYLAPFAQLDMAYRATRPIAQGEEILVDYGPAWEAAWFEYLVKLQAWDKAEIKKRNVDSFPLFRAYIAAPEGLFPLHWEGPQGEEENIIDEVMYCRADDDECIAL